MKKARILVPLILTLVILGDVLGGCRFREESPVPESRQEIPPLPKALEGEAGKEPVLQVYLSEEGTLQEMKFEDYIAGVVAAEMDPTWPTQALAAQAVIARSFTLQKIDEQGGVPQRNAHASTDIEEFQAYDAGRINDRVRQAVKMTRGEVAVYQGEFIRGWFHAYAGPRSALADEGLEFEGGNPPYIKIVESPATDIIPAEERDWSASFSLEEVREAVAELAGRDPGPIREVKISKKGPSGRATRLKFNDVEVSAPSLRIELDSQVFRSTFIEKLEVKEGTLFLEGTGYGHGVGMCQWGARALAEEGRSYDDIVRYFYKDISLVRMWS
ncbi:MAG: SpoIID/LytB domain-containing protein [Dethiobacteria bacterium]